MATRPPVATPNGSAATAVHEAGQLRPGGLRHAIIGLIVTYAVLTACWTAMGLVITGPLDGSWLTQTDQTVASWFVEQRTPSWNRWSGYGSMLADTNVKVVATAVIAGVMFVAWRSWRAPFLVIFALVLEASVFITTTWFVARHRPDVVRLDSSVVDTSFPSGHAAAATAYGAIVVVVFERTRNTTVRIACTVLVVTVSIVVSVARLYRGMHYLTDVIAGIVLGIASIVAVYLVARRCYSPPPPPPLSGDDATSRAPAAPPDDPAARGAPGVPHPTQRGGAP